MTIELDRRFAAFSALLRSPDVEVHTLQRAVDDIILEVFADERISDEEHDRAQAFMANPYDDLIRSRLSHVCAGLLRIVERDDAAMRNNVARIARARPRAPRIELGGGAIADFLSTPARGLQPGFSVRGGVALETEPGSAMTFDARLSHTSGIREDTGVGRGTREARDTVVQNTTTASVSVGGEMALNHVVSLSAGGGITYAHTRADRRWSDVFVRQFVDTRTLDQHVVRVPLSGVTSDHSHFLGLGFTVGMGFRLGPVTLRPEWSFSLGASFSETAPFEEGYAPPLALRQESAMRHAGFTFLTSAGLSATFRLP